MARGTQPAVLYRSRGSSAVRLILAALVCLGAGCEVPSKYIDDVEQSAIEIVTDTAALRSCESRRVGAQRAYKKNAVLSANRYRCRIVAVYSGVSVTPSVDARHPDPLVRGPTAVAVNSKGIIYTPAAGESRVLAWNADGSFLAAVAQQGDGPGEISGRVVSLFTDHADSLHVRDARGRWLVFDLSHTFVRQFQGPREAQLVSHFDASRLLHTAPVAGAPKDVVFHLTDLEGKYLSSHGSPRSANANADAQRPSTIGIDGSVWIAPRRGTEGFVIERRSIDGELLQFLRREVAWLPLEGYANIPLAPDFKILHTDQRGLLWVGAGVKDPEWQVPVGGSVPSPGEDQSDFRLEVIDAEVAEVLASVRFDILDSRELPPIFPVGRWSRQTWGVSTDSLGFGSIRLYKLFLAEHKGK